MVENIPTFKAKSTAESKWTVIKPIENQEEAEIPAEDEQPQIVGEVPTTGTVQGGLQTSSQIKAQLQAKQSYKRREASVEVPEEEEEETVYRDSSGKKIDTKQLRAEEKRKQARSLEKAMRKMEWGKGLVQRQDKKADANELSKIAAQPFAR